MRLNNIVRVFRVIRDGESDEMVSVILAQDGSVLAFIPLGTPALPSFESKPSENLVEEMKMVIESGTLIIGGM